MTEHTTECDLDEDCTCGAAEEKTCEYRCLQCGSPEVQHAHWVDMNTNEIGEPFGSWCWGDNSYCAKCEGPVKIVTQHDPEWNDVLVKAKLAEA